MSILWERLKKALGLSNTPEKSIIADETPIQDTTLDKPVIVEKRIKPSECKEESNPPASLEPVIAYKVSKPLEHLKKTLKNQYNPHDYYKIQAEAMKHAVHLGDLEVISFLIQTGHFINWQYQDGRTALMYACNGGQIEAARLLIKNGANVNIQTDSGLTALMFACKIGDMKMAQFLIKECNADPFLKDNKGFTALEFASESYNSNKEYIVTLLKCAINQYFGNVESATEEIKEFEARKTKKYSDATENTVINAWSPSQESDLSTPDHPDAVLPFTLDNALVGVCVDF